MRRRCPTPNRFAPLRIRPGRRRGGAAVELAVLLPFLAFCFVVGMDYSRVFYYAQAVHNAAAAGALYGCQGPSQAADTDRIAAAAWADTTNLTPAPTVTSSQGTDADGHPTVSVTVSYNFGTVTRFPGVPASTLLTRTVTMCVIPE